jgi:polyisoprenoid-binding protein YceI
MVFLRLQRCARLGPLLLLTLAIPRARAEPVPYVLDQRYGTIEFSTSGLLATQGYFRRFAGHLALDFQHPENSMVNVSVDDSAFTVSTPLAAPTLRSAAYFDSAQFPQVTFRSLSITPLTLTHFQIHGELTIRGVTRMQDMDARLVSAPALSMAAGTADFFVSGMLHRSDFGMAADRNLVDDTVGLKIHARVELEKPRS